MDLLLDLLARHLSEYAYLGLFCVLVFGSLGLPVPEEIVLIAAGLFVAQGATSLVPTLLVCLAGQIVGDLSLYAVGRRYGQGALRGLFKRVVTPARRDRTATWLDRYGLVIVFLGRYLTGIRPAVFLGAGAARIPVRRFVLVDGLSAIVSLLVWGGIGWRFSPWIAVVLGAVRQAEEMIVAAVAATIAVLLGERLLLGRGRLRESSAAVRVTNWVRIPLVVATAVFAVLLARGHQIARRAQLVEEGTAPAPAVVEDMALLIDVLADLAHSDTPIEVVFVGARPLLLEALAPTGFEPSGSGPHCADLFQRPPEAHLSRMGDRGPVSLAFWRSNYRYRAAPVWFGSFEGDVTQADLTALTRTLTRTNYALRTMIGPRLRNGERRRVLVAVLRYPAIGEPRTKRL